MAHDQTQLIQLEDIRRLAEGGAPDLAQAVLALLAQPDPSPAKTPKTSAYGLRTLLMRAYATGGEERRVAIAQTWQRYLAETDPPPPPRFFLAELLVELYDQGGEAGRAALVEIARAAPFSWGVWGGLKRIYKLSEERHDAELFGALAARFDLEAAKGGVRNDVSAATIWYLRTRAWRWLRQLGKAAPELYPQFVVQTLLHYPNDADFTRTWLANHVFRHRASGAYGKQKFFYVKALPDDLYKDRAYDDAWKRLPDPLMLLLEGAQADAPARFAIQGLRKDFPQVLRSVTPAWLDRVSRRPLASVHEFVVDTLQASPELHQGKLKGLGLHETVLALLLSPSARARAYAIEYTRAHAQDLPAERLVELVGVTHKDTVELATAMLQARPAKALGHVLLGRLLTTSLATWAAKALGDGFDRTELPRAFLVDMIFGAEAQRRWAVEYLAKRFQPGEIDAGFWKGIIDDPRQQQPGHAGAQGATRQALAELGKLDPATIGAAWLLDTALRPGFQVVWGWLQKAERLPGLDIEKVKGLVFDPAYRQLAVSLLSNPKVARLKELTLPWLLALARRADPTLNQFASRYLLQHVAPADFSDRGDAASGIERLFQLALGAKEPESVRQFAHTYLRCHHPGIGPAQPESRSYQLTAQMPLDGYTPERLWPALADARADVRRFAVAITRADLRRWGWQQRVYELADADAKEVRAIAYDALLKAGDPQADPALTLTPEELDAARVFAMTESRIRSTRETAMELIARHYQRLGGAERLAWIMASADRSVRLMAVRLLWEKHRPRDLPPGWQPKGRVTAPVESAGKLASGPADVAALRDFLRTVLYGLPPGRSKEPRDGDGPRRHVAASEAKRRLIEVVRDLGVEEIGFAGVVAPVLAEMSGSLARGEWQSCLAAMMHLRAAHPGLDVGVVDGTEAR